LQADRAQDGVARRLLQGAPAGKADESIWIWGARGAEQRYRPGRLLMEVAG
jgi:hypothetical protein